ncbi:ThuA domain-containing protein [Paraglaciecola sp. L3A3]|uniref:ThuA domain-containing protein n=1 Tax=Paraglaciecola sp. L3A3 TaxID=2686358 RepID=UPI00131B6C4F|nr:ThuA domain-containing protein [Paraglaciecola sp. L3A3]
MLKIFTRIRMLVLVTCLLSTSSFAEQFKVLLFTKSAAWHHKSVNEGVDAIKLIAQNHHFEVVWHEDANQFKPENLKQYQAVIFLQTTGDILNDQQQAALKGFIQAGNGFVGIHSASDTEYGWPWFGKLVGRRFHIHPQIQTARMSVINNSFPGLEYFPESGLWTEEWYEFGEELSPNLQYILSVDESTYDPKVQWGDKIGKGLGDFHPVAWYQNIEGGRSFYTALGHMPATYSNKAFQEHIFGGIYWAATGKGMKK